MSRLELKVTQEVLQEKAATIKTREDIVEITGLLVDFRRQQQMEQGNELTRLFVGTIISKLMGKIKDNPFNSVYTTSYGINDKQIDDVLGMLSANEAIIDDICSELKEKLNLKFVTVDVDTCVIVQIGF